MKIIKIILVVSLLFSFTSCTNIENSDGDIFDFSIDVPKTVINVGEKVTFTATLKNLTDKEYTLAHVAVPSPICISFRDVDDDFSEVFTSITKYTNIDSYGIVEEIIEVEPQEVGEYLLKASCFFSVDENVYEFEPDDVLITVVE
jgi:hypothetical protein